ncbi:MAG TPA: ATP-binding protein [Steroidobacteraceae bacterium]|jgi:two-component system OmpR family sensor kinase|nr:ATP-binding protein [Steroidobacteraceae bacterium]
MRVGSPQVSLRTSLLVWLLGGVVLAGVAGGFVVYRNALAEADAFFDYHLKETALFLRDQPVEYQFPTPIPPSDIAYDFVVQIWTIDGRRIYIGPEQAVLPNSTALGYSTVNSSVGQWRVYGAASPTKVVQVAQPMSVRRREAAQLALRTLAPFALLVPLLGLLVWFAVGHSLQPLQRLAKAVKARRVNELEPLSDERLPEEVRPLVGSLNDLLGRLSAALDRERAFMADAAHELRTPLTALHLQLGALARAGTEGERTEAMGKLSEGVQRAIRLVEQLLALARQEPRAEPVRTRFALDELAREVVAELVPLADARRIDLGMSEAQAVLVRGERDAVATLVRNLVDNAVRYTPPGGRVDVSVERSAATPAQALVKVMDNGPGIAPEERDRVFDRFYRRPGTAAPGSGLGMAIVKAIAEAHGAGVMLDSGESGRGLAVTVSFPAEGA